MSDLYNRIQDKAREKGLTVGALCEKAGVYRTRMADLKSGRTKALSDDVIRKFANTLGTTPEALLYDEADKRIFHVDLDNKRPDFSIICEQMETDELLELLDTVASILRRRRNVEK